MYCQWLFNYQSNLFWLKFYWYNNKFGIIIPNIIIIITGFHFMADVSEKSDFLCLDKKLITNRWKNLKVVQNIYLFVTFCQSRKLML